MYLSVDSAGLLTEIHLPSEACEIIKSMLIAKKIDKNRKLSNIETVFKNRIGWVRSTTGTVTYHQFETRIGLPRSLGVCCLCSQKIEWSVDRYFYEHRSTFMINPCSCSLY